MTLQDYIRNEYFEWMYNLISSDKHVGYKSYRKLMMFLHNTEFRYSIPKDENRSFDGVDLRYRFTHFTRKDVRDSLDGPCSVLEMMIALAIRCEENIMDNPDVGDRTAQWFWGMIVSLGLGAMSDDRFDREVAGEIIERFLDRKYEANGKGGLFTIKHCKRDLRKVEIWYQLCWYLDNMV